MRKITAVLLLMMIMAGCAAKPLASLKNEETEELIVDIRNADQIKSEDYLELEEGAEASAVLDEENSKIIFTVTKDDKTETYEQPVTIQYPLGEFNTDDITLDVYTGYDVTDYMDLAEGTEVTEELNEETGELTVTMTNGNRTETITTQVNVTDSNPFPKYYVADLRTPSGELDADHTIEVTLYEDGHVHIYVPRTGKECDIEDFVNQDTPELACEGTYYKKIYFDDDGFKYQNPFGPFSDGTYDYEVGYRVYPDEETSETE